ncbi:hypothetical protein D3C78_1730310 [compost metagenome]
MHHVAGIETHVHLHDSYASFAIASPQSALDRCRTAPAWQQRAMNVDAAQARHIQHGFRQDQAVGYHHHHVRIQVGNQVLILLRAQ